MLSSISLTAITCFARGRWGKRVGGGVNEGKTMDHVFILARARNEAATELCEASRGEQDASAWLQHCRRVVASSRRQALTLGSSSPPLACAAVSMSSMLSVTLPKGTDSGAGGAGGTPSSCSIVSNA